MKNPCGCAATSAWEARCIETAPTDIWDYVPRLKTPTLVIFGEKSKTFLPEVVERFGSEVPHAVFKRFNGNGHNVIMENPEGVADVIMGFVKDLALDKISFKRE